MRQSNFPLVWIVMLSVFSTITLAHSLDLNNRFEDKNRSFTFSNLSTNARLLTVQFFLNFTALIPIKVYSKDKKRKKYIASAILGTVIAITFLTSAIIHLGVLVSLV